MIRAAGTVVDDSVLHVYLCFLDFIFKNNEDINNNKNTKQSKEKYTGQNDIKLY